LCSVFAAIQRHRFILITQFAKHGAYGIAP
jgi:hypothetical protein